MRSFPLSDTSLFTISAGFFAVLVGIASSAAIVFEAARAADETVIASWVGALGLGMGLTYIVFSWYYRAPVLPLMPSIYLLACVAPAWWHYSALFQKR